MHSLSKYLLWLHVFVLYQAIAFCQEDSTNKQPETSTETPSPIGVNKFSLDSLKHPIKDKVVYIRHIYIDGIKMTRRKILLRELPFQEGDSIAVSKLPEAFEKAKVQIMNTRLFHRAEVSLYDVNEPDIDVNITVKERWFIYPIPYVKPIDRNLNQWLFDKGASTTRLDYGIKLNHDNLTHNSDKLRLYLVSGYTRQLMISYTRPYIDSAMKWGISTTLALGKTHEINAGTQRDTQQFVKDPEIYTRNFFNGVIEFSYRPKFYTKHYFGFSYNTLNVADTVVKFNPNFLKNGITKIAYPEVHYRLVYQNLDYIPYPTSGYAGEIFVSKQGINNKMNLWQLSVKGQGNWHLGQKSFYSISALGTLKLPFDQPFYNKQMMGYSDFTLRGYEHYVIDGVAGGLINATIYRQIADFSFRVPFLSKWLTDRLIPLKIYGKVYGNTGYVYDPDPVYSRLANKMMYGGGFGVDILTVNDFSLKIEFSFNQLGENGIYLQKKTLY